MKEMINKELKEFKESSEAYKVLVDFYKDKKSLRAGAPCINQIDEGLKIMLAMEYSLHAMYAYCLYPIFQFYEDFNEVLSIDFSGVNRLHILLAVESARVANSYLPTGKKEDFIGFTNHYVESILLADKFQNYQDFRRYHLGKNENSDRLEEYFDDWKTFLLENKYREEGQTLGDLKQRMTEYIDSVLEE